jgi:ATP-binding cassette, subfamily B, bacterial
MSRLRRLLPFLRPYRWQVLGVLLFTVGGTAASLLAPWLVRELIRAIEGGGGGVNAIAWISFGLLGALLLQGLFQFLSYWVAHVLAWWLCHDLRMALYDHLQRLSLSFYSRRQTGELQSRVLKDTENLEPLVADVIPEAIANALLFFGVATILFVLNPGLAALTLIPVPLLVLTVWFIGKKVYAAFEQELERLGALSAAVQDNLSGIKEIQIFTRERRERERLGTLSARYAADQVRARKLDGALQPTVLLFSGIGTVVVAFFGGRAALIGEVPVADLVAFILYLAIFYQPIILLAEVSEYTQRALASAGRVSEVLETESEVKDPSRGADPGRLRGEVRFEDVGFGYVAGVPVLRGVSFAVEPGQTLALVGPTGAGKSTIASLVPRFYDAREGRVLLDGTDVREMRLPAVRANVSMVLQDTFLFNGTVLDNLRFGNEAATEEAVVRAARLAGAHDFIEGDLPDGYRTQVGERGVKLSGGQKQRISIARAILKDAPILVLDEATSSVDAETEAGIQEALGGLMRDRTAIVIAHRLSTVRDADAIAVIDEGRVVQLGRHEDLISAPGLYRKLYKRQFGAVA